MGNNGRNGNESEMNRKWIGVLILFFFAFEKTIRAFLWGFWIVFELFLNCFWFFSPCFWAVRGNFFVGSPRRLGGVGMLLSTICSLRSFVLFVHLFSPPPFPGAKTKRSGVKKFRARKTPKNVKLDSYFSSSAESWIHFLCFHHVVYNLCLYFVCSSYGCCPTIHPCPLKL